MYFEFLKINPNSATALWNKNSDEGLAVIPLQIVIASLFNSLSKASLYRTVHLTISASSTKSLSVISIKHTVTCPAPISPASVSELSNSSSVNCLFS